MSESTAECAYQWYTQHGVGAETLLSRTEFDEFWSGLDTPDRQYWLQQFRGGPTRLSKEFVAGLSSSEEEPLDPELLKKLAERWRSLGTFSAAKP
jgi:hypothetical protein